MYTESRCKHAGVDENVSPLCVCQKFVCTHEILWCYEQIYCFRMLNFYVSSLLWNHTRRLYNQHYMAKRMWTPESEYYTHMCLLWSHLIICCNNSSFGKNERFWNLAAGIWWLCSGLHAAQSSSKLRKQFFIDLVCALENMFKCWNRKVLPQTVAIKLKLLYKWKDFPSLKLRNLVKNGPNQ